MSDKYPIRVCVLLDIIADTPMEAYGKVHLLIGEAEANHKDLLDGWETSDSDWYGVDGEPLTEDEILAARHEFFQKLRNEREGAAFTEEPDLFEAIELAFTPAPELYAVLTSDGDEYESCVRPCDVEAIVSNCAKSSGNLNYDYGDNVELEVDPPAAGLAGEWLFSLQPLRLEKGRYYGPPEDCYPDEYVNDGQPEKGTVLVVHFCSQCDGWIGKPGCGEDGHTPECVDATNKEKP